MRTVTPSAARPAPRGHNCPIHTSCESSEIPPSVLTQSFPASGSPWYPIRYFPKAIGTLPRISFADVLVAPLPESPLVGDSPRVEVDESGRGVLVLVISVRLSRGRGNAASSGPANRELGRANAPLLHGTLWHGLGPVPKTHRYGSSRPDRATDKRHRKENETEALTLTRDGTTITDSNMVLRNVGRRL